MTDNERRLLLALATLAAGKPTGEDFATVEDALAVVEPLTANDNILILGLGQLWNLAGTHRHDPNTGVPETAEGKPIA